MTAMASRSRTIARLPSPGVFAEARATDRYRDLAEPDDDEEMLQIVQMC